MKSDTRLTRLLNGPIEFKLAWTIFILVGCFRQYYYIRVKNKTVKLLGAIFQVLEYTFILQYIKKEKGPEKWHQTHFLCILNEKFTQLTKKVWKCFFFKEEDDETT